MNMTHNDHAEIRPRFESAGAYRTSARDGSSPNGESTPDFVPGPEMLPTDRQLQYARRIADAGGIQLPASARNDRTSMSRWISENCHFIRGADSRKPRVANPGTPSSKQVAWAERIAKGRRRTIPDECFKSRQLLSAWIDSNKW